MSERAFALVCNSTGSTRKTGGVRCRTISIVSMSFYYNIVMFPPNRLGPVLGSLGLTQHNLRLLQLRLGGTILLTTGNLLFQLRHGLGNPQLDRLKDSLGLLCGRLLTRQSAHHVCLKSSTNLTCCLSINSSLPSLSNCSDLIFSSRILIFASWSTSSLW